MRKAVMPSTGQKPFTKPADQECRHAVDRRTKMISKTAMGGTQEGMLAVWIAFRGIHPL